MNDNIPEQSEGDGSLFVKVRRITQGDPLYPDILMKRLGADAPGRLTLIGNPGLLDHRKTALFCSARAPGGAILCTFDTVRRLRDDGITVISGFHSPIEKECLRILLRGEQPIIICPGRAIDAMRIPAECRSAFDAGRILFLSRFIGEPRRATRESALIRNELVAALADEAYIAYAAPNSFTEQLTARLISWGVPLLTP